MQLENEHNVHPIINEAHGDEIDYSEESIRRRKVTKAATRWVGKTFKPGVPEQCAVFVRTIFSEVGLPLPVAEHPSDLTLVSDLPQGAEYANSLSSEEVGYVVNLDRAKPGDLLLFKDTYAGDFPPGCITHVGIYVGENKMVHRSTFDSPVLLQTIDDWWRSRLYEVVAPYVFTAKSLKDR